MGIEFIQDTDDLTYKTVRECMHDYDDATTSDLRAAFELTYYDAENEETVTFSVYGDTMDFLKRNRGSWYFLYDEINGSPEKIGTALQRWWGRRKDTYGWLDKNLKRTDYDPLENYDRKEDGGWKDDHDIGARSGTDNLTDTYAATQETVTETPRATRTTTMTPGVKNTTERFVYGDNSSTAVPADKTTVTPDATTPDVVTEAGTDGTDTTVTAALQHIDTHNRSTGALAAKDTDTRLFQNYRVHGNIGVSTVADMLTKEVNLRRDLDLQKMALTEFLDLYTFYVG